MFFINGELFHGFDTGYLHSYAEESPQAIFEEDDSTLGHYETCGDIVGCCSY